MLKHDYSAGRNDNHLKVKRFYDAEAVVVGHETGKGKNAGRLGALVCIDASGRRFKVGTGACPTPTDATLFPPEP